MRQPSPDLTSAWVLPRPVQMRKPWLTRSHAIQIYLKALRNLNANVFRSQGRPSPRAEVLGNTCWRTLLLERAPTASTGENIIAFPVSSSIPRPPHSCIQLRSSSHPMRTQDLPVPELARNMRLIGHCDQGGRPDGVQLMVHRGFAYIGHMFSKGFSVVDVRASRNPRAVASLPAPPGTWHIHL